MCYLCNSKLRTAYIALLVYNSKFLRILTFALLLVYDSKFGGAEESRTPDLLLARQAL